MPLTKMQGLSRLAVMIRPKQLGMLLLFAHNTRSTPNQVHTPPYSTFCSAYRYAQQPHHAGLRSPGPKQPCYCWNNAAAVNNSLTSILGGWVENVCIIFMASALHPGIRQYSKKQICCKSWHLMREVRPSKVLDGKHSEVSASRVLDQAYSEDALPKLQIQICARLHLHLSREWMPDQFGPLPLRALSTTVRSQSMHVSHADKSRNSRVSTSSVEDQHNGIMIMQAQVTP